MSNIKPLLKISFKHPNGRIAIATKSLISVMAERERHSVNSKQASQNSEYWRRAEVISKVATTDVELALSLLDSLEKTASTQDFDIFDLQGFSLNTIKKLAKLDSVLAVQQYREKRDNLHTEVLNPRNQLKKRNKALMLLNNMIKKDPDSERERQILVREWNASLEESFTLTFKNPRTKKKVEKEYKLKAMKNYPKQRVAPLKRQMKKVYEEKFFEFSQKIAELSETAVENYINTEIEKGKAERQQQQQNLDDEYARKREEILSRGLDKPLSRKDMYYLYDEGDSGMKSKWTEEEFQEFLDANWTVDKSQVFKVRMDMENEFWSSNFPSREYTEEELEMLSGNELRAALAKTVKKLERQNKKDMKSVANTPKNRKQDAEFLYDEYMYVKPFLDALEQFKGIIESLAEERDNTSF